MAQIEISEEEASLIVGALNGVVFRGTVRQLAPTLVLVDTILKKIEAVLHDLSAETAPKAGIEEE